MRTSPRNCSKLTISSRTLNDFRVTSPVLIRPVFGGLTLVFGKDPMTSVTLQVSGLLAEPLPFDDCLVSPELCTKWCTGVWRPTEAIASSVGDEFYTRAKLVGVFVDRDGDPDRSRDKGRKIYGFGAPTTTTTTTLTSSNNFKFVDDRSSGPLHVGVRQLEFSEVLKISGFDNDLSATAFLKSRSEEDALKTVASAIPPPTLYYLYRAIVPRL